MADGVDHERRVAREDFSGQVRHQVRAVDAQPRLPRGRRVCLAFCTRGEPGQPTMRPSDRLRLPGQLVERQGLLVARRGRAMIGAVQRDVSQAQVANQSLARSFTDDLGVVTGKRGHPTSI
jgi:hypothetical protein